MCRVRNYIVIITLILFKINVFAQAVYESQTYDNSIKSVQFYRTGNELSYPYLVLNESTTLTIEFDELSDQVSEYHLEMFHCNADWTKSILIPMEYIDGFDSEKFNDYKHSQNTRKSFIHYRHSFPSPSTRFKMSGNYLVKIFRYGQDNEPIITKRFLVMDEKITIQPNLGISGNSPSQRSKLQAVNFNIIPGRFPSFNPSADFQVVVLQNFRWDNARKNIKPMFIYPDKLEYGFNSENDFTGGNEYRKLDLRSFGRYGIEIERILWSDTTYFVIMNQDKPRTNNVYQSNFDFNGNFYIGTRTAPTRSELDIEADYSYVTFRLQAEEAYSDGNVFLFGNFTDWKAKEQFKLRYKPAKGYYETEILLKQGIYDYQYILQKTGSKEVDETKIEGSHFETENYYTILVYFKGIGDKSDQLIGFKHINYYD